MNPPPTARPTLASIPVDLPCFGCRYNLRTLSSDAICPECALPVGRTLKHGWLIFAEPAWLRRVRGGLSLLLLTLLVWPVGIAIIVFYAVFSAGGEPDAIIMAVLTWSIGVVYIALWLFGVWGVTTPEPASNPGRAPSKLGPWIRALHVVAILMLGASFYISSGDQEVPSPSPFDLLRIFWPVTVSWTAYALGFLLLVAHMRRLARRIIKPTLRKLLTFLLWGGIFFAALAVTGVAIALGAAYTATVSGGGAAGPGPTMAPTTMTVRAVPMGVSASWTPTTAPTTGPATVVAPVVATPLRMPFAMLFGVLVAASFYLFILVWGGAGLLALISFRRILNQTIHENASAAYAAWLNPPSLPRDGA